MPKHGTKGKRRQAGFSVVEAAISAFLVAISISGLVISTTYGQRLESSTATMWRATGAATATLEKIRSDSATRWSSLADDWNAQSCAASGLADSVTSKLTATVTSDEALAGRPRGMWTTGATAPNFLFVQIAPGATGSALSRSLFFQTYIANREGLLESVAAMPQDETTGGIGKGSMGGITGAVNSGHTAGGNSTAPASAESVLTTASNIALSGLLSDTLTFDLVNASSNNLALTSVKLTGSKGTALTTASMGNTLLVNVKKPSTHLAANDAASLVPAGMPPGPVTFTVTSDDVNLAGKTVTIELTFADKSTTTVTVKP